MRTAVDRLDLAPPPQPGLVRGVGLALLAHAVLLAALTWGVGWNRDNDTLSAEAELWSATPQQAAPRPAAPPPAPRPPEPVAPTPSPPPAQREADIAVEREKQRRQLQDKQRAEELERQRQAAEQQKKLAAQKQQQEEQARAARSKQEEQARLARQKLEEAKMREELRREQIARAQGLAGATGSPSATGTALRSSGPSDSYAGRIRARVQPNIVFGDVVSGNPQAEVEVRMAPDGSITSTRVVKGSGVKSWDDAVVRALERTGTLPRDVDGRVHSPVIIAFRPKG